MNALRAAAVIGFMWCGRHYVTYAVTLNGRVRTVPCDWRGRLL